MASVSVESDDLETDDGGVYGDVPDEAFDNVDDVEGRGVLGEWELMDRLNISLDIEPIDRILLEHARKEVNVVMENIRRMIPDGMDPDVQLTPNDFFKVWFDKCLLDSMVFWLTRYFIPLGKR
jgi:hypothetical protein